MMTTDEHGKVRRWRAAAVAVVGLALITPSVHAQDDEAASRFDGLVPLEGGRVAMAYVDPNADFSVFKRVMILEPYVAFRSNWQRDQNRNRSRPVRTRDMQRIKADVASLFLEVFSEVLSADDGFEVVEAADYDVLLLRPAIIDLDVTAPDTMASGRTQTFSASTGAATLYIELFDSVSGDIIGRAADRRGARQSSGQITWSNRVTNTAEARRIMTRWAQSLRGFLESHYTKNTKNTKSE
jgi:hypothetical protein